MFIVLTACGGGSDAAEETPSPADPNGTTQEETPPPTEEPGDPVDPEDPEDQNLIHDMGERTIRLGAHWNIYPFDSSSARPDPATSDNYEADVMMYERMRAIEQMYNVRFEIVNVDWGMMQETLVTSVLAGDPWADIMQIEGPWFIPAIMNDLILPSEEFVRPHNDIAGPQEVMRWDGQYFGRYWIFRETELNIYGAFLGYNRDILDALGLPDPGELANRGEWTWDAFMEMAITATTGDTHGFSGTLNRHAFNFIASNGVPIVNQISLSHNLDSPALMNAFQFIQDMYFTHRVAYLTNDDIWSWDADWEFRNGNSLFFGWYHWMIPSGDEALPFNYGIVPFPIGPDNTSGTTHFNGPWGRGLLRGTADPEWVYTIFEDLTRWWGDDRGILDDDGITYLATILHTMDDINRLVDLSTYTGLPDVSENVPGLDAWRIWVPVALGEMTVAQAIETYRLEIENAIDNALNP